MQINPFWQMHHNYTKNQTIKNENTNYQPTGDEVRCILQYTALSYWRKIIINSMEQDMNNASKASAMSWWLNFLWVSSIRVDSQLLISEKYHPLLYNLDLLTTQCAWHFNRIAGWLICCLDVCWKSTHIQSPQISLAKLKLILTNWVKLTGILCRIRIKSNLYITQVIRSVWQELWLISC